MNKYNFFFLAYSTSCTSLTSELKEGSITITDAFGSQTVYSIPSVYGLSDGKYAVVIISGN